MDKNSTGIKKKIAMAAVLVGAVLSILTFLFIHEVKEELWKQSVQTIIESTQQGCNTPKVPADGRLPVHGYRHAEPEGICFRAAGGTGTPYG